MLLSQSCLVYLNMWTIKFLLKHLNRMQLLSLYNWEWWVSFTVRVVFYTREGWFKGIINVNLRSSFLKKEIPEWKSTELFVYSGSFFLISVVSLWPEILVLFKVNGKFPIDFSGAIFYCLWIISILKEIFYI